MEHHPYDIPGVVDKRPTDLKTVYRPAPWCYLRDEFWAYLAILVLAIASPLMGFLIGTAELVWKVWMILKSVVSFAPVGRAIYGLAVGAKILKDPRNSPYLPTLLWLSVWTPLIFSWAVYRYKTYGLELWVVFVYHFLRIGPRFRSFAYYHVMAHKEGHDHNGFFRPPLTFLNFRLVQWGLALFYGQVPMSYCIGHNKIHHRYNNLLDDVHTCYDLDRTKPFSFLVYLPRFAAYWSGFSVTWFFLMRSDWKFAGMLFYFSIVGAVIWHAWDFGVCYLLFPHLESIVFFGAISYLWHSFIDSPACEYINSVTIIKGKDNIFNEDFHVVHHHPNPNIHWTEYPAHYEQHKSEYIRNQATIFTDCEEGEMLYWLFSEKWDELASHFVDLQGKMTHEQKKELVLRRLSTTLIDSRVLRKKE